MPLIANVLRRVKEGEFVQFINGKLLDKDDNEIFVNYEPSGPVTPQAQLSNLGWDLGFKKALSPEEPGDGYFRLSDDVMSEVGLMWISDVDANGVSMVGRRGLIRPGDNLYVRSKTNPSTILSIWGVTGASVAKTLYAEIPVSFVAGTALPDAIEPCEIIHVPGGSTALTEAIMLTAMPGVARFSFGGAGGTIDGFFTASGEFVSFINPVYTFAQLAAMPITSANDGFVVRIDPASFGGGSSRVAKNIQAVANLASGAWEPVGGKQLLYSAYSSAASPLATLAGIVGNALTQFSLGVDGNFSIPANFLKLGRGLHVIAKVGKTGTSTGTTAAATRFGKNNATSDQLISSITLANVSLQQGIVEGVARVTGVGAGSSVFTADSLMMIAQTANNIGDRTISFDSTLVNYVSVTVDPVTDTDTHALYMIEIWWV